MKRRDAIGVLAGGLGAVLTACRDPFDPNAPRGGSPRLTARPGTPTGSVATGASTIALSDGGEARLFVPAAHDGVRPLPLVVVLHGLGGRSADAMAILQPFADLRSLILLATNSKAPTWDAITGDFGADVAVLDEALRAAFDRCLVDPDRVRIQGFSDGATYALTLGLANGDLFSRVAAQSPGALIPASRAGTPSVYITHGIFDPVFPVDRTGIRVADALISEGYDVRYEEYEGGHEVPGTVANAVAVWLA